MGGRPRTGSPEWRFNAKANRAQWMARVTLKNGERSPWIALDPKISQDDKEAAQAATRIIAQWKEQHDDASAKIIRPRQIYTGNTVNDYIPIDRRAR